MRVRMPNHQFTNSLWSQSHRSENGTAVAHRQTGVQRLEPFDRHLAQHRGGHAQHGVHQVVRLAVARHHVRQLRIVEELHRLPRVGRHILQMGLWSL